MNRGAAQTGRESFRFFRNLRRSLLNASGGWMLRKVRHPRQPVACHRSAMRTGTIEVPPARTFLRTMSPARTLLIIRIRTHRPARTRTRPADPTGQLPPTTQNLPRRCPVCRVLPIGLLRLGLRRRVLLMRLLRHSLRRRVFLMRLLWHSLRRRTPGQLLPANRIFPHRSR